MMLSLANSRYWQSRQLLSLMSFIATADIAPALETISVNVATSILPRIIPTTPRQKAAKIPVNIMSIGSIEYNVFHLILWY